jgi:hypothetical protein
MLYCREQQTTSGLTGSADRDPRERGSRPLNSNRQAARYVIASQPRRLLDRNRFIS